MSASPSLSVRRSSRISAKVPVRVTSLQPNAQFSEICETLVVSAHGCALRLPVKLDTGSAVRLHRRGGRQVTAYVVFCQPMGPNGQSFRLGAQLERPENIWGLESFPDDWKVIEMPVPAGQRVLEAEFDGMSDDILDESPAKSVVVHQSVHPSVHPSAHPSVHQLQTPARATREILDKIEEKLSEERLRGVLAKFVEPLQMEVAELREKLTSTARRNRFEVSLGYIPPELEEKLWERLRQDVGKRVLEQTREQSAEILGSAKITIEQMISAESTDFRQRLGAELHAVEKRAQELATELTIRGQQEARGGIEKLQRRALEVGAHLERQSEKLLGSLQGQLAESHLAHRGEIEQMQADVAAKAAQLHSEVSELGARIGALNESVRRLESELDAHLVRVAGEIVTGAEGQIESAVALALKNLQARGSNEIETSVGEMCSHLRTIQNRIENSFVGSVTAQGEEAVQSITLRLEELAEKSTRSWRVALARDLSSVAEALGRELRREVGCERGPS
ncbi:MAG: hypothetical protein WA213_05670 [Terriglobales bacterium]